MKPRLNISLKSYNSFSVTSVCPQFFPINNLADLTSLIDIDNSPFYILGEGSNTLFIEDNSPDIIKVSLKGIKLEALNDCYRLTVAAGENWHKLVCYCTEHGFYGLENLALIPGSVGAAPVQNIGAYGVEIADYCAEVHWYNLSTQQIEKLSRESCRFGYRDSIFKHELKNKGLITSIVLTLPKKWQPQLSYRGLDKLADNVTAETVMNTVIELRQAKLPDPKILPNAGSFFKNPVVSKQIFETLINRFPHMPNYPQESGQVKLAAGWLIEQAGLKGYTDNQVGVHKNQALVLVNYGSECGTDILMLAQHVQKSVKEYFDISIQPEVRLVNEVGECDFSDLKNLNAHVKIAKQ